MPHPFETRPVWFNDDKPNSTPVFARDDLPPEHEIIGPAIIEQLDATTVLHPGDRATVDRALNLHIEIAQ